MRARTITDGLRPAQVSGKKKPRNRTASLFPLPRGGLEGSIVSSRGQLARSGNISPVTMNRIVLPRRILGIALMLSVLLGRPASGLTLDEIENHFQSAYQVYVGEKYAAELADLDSKYLAALERALSQASAGEKLEDAVAIRNEMLRVKNRGALPEVDEPVLAKLRGTYREQVDQLNSERSQAAAPILEKFSAALLGFQDELTRSGNLDEALAVRDYRAGNLSEKLTGETGSREAKPESVTLRERGSDRGSNGLRILVEDSHGQSSATNTFNFGLSGASAKFVELGHRVDSASELVKQNQRPLAVEDLRNYDLVMTVLKYSGMNFTLSEAECRMFEIYVRDGGWLLIGGASHEFGDKVIPEFYEPLLKRFDAAFESEIIRSATVTLKPGSPLAQGGVKSIACNSDAVAPVAFSRRVRPEILGEMGDTPVVSTLKFGKGRLIVFGSGMALVNTFVAPPPSRDGGKNRQPVDSNVKLLVNLVRWRQAER